MNCILSIKSTYKLCIYMLYNKENLCIYLEECAAIMILFQRLLMTYDPLWWFLFIFFIFLLLFRWLVDEISESLPKVGYPFFVSYTPFSCMPISYSPFALVMHTLFNVMKTLSRYSLFFHVDANKFSLYVFSIV